VNNPLHLDFVVASSYLRAFTYGLISSELKPIDLEETIEQIKRSVVKIQPPEFVPQKVKIPTNPDDSAGARAVVESEEDEDQVIQQIIASLPKPEEFGSWRAQSVSFEKDDDRNFHIDFVTAASNLRATAYNIPTADRLKSKLIAGKIVPAIVTTTAVVTGFVQLEFYKLHALGVSKPIEHYRNSFVNLALPLFSQSEPLPPPKAKNVATGEDFTLWDKIEIREGELTLQQLLDWFKTKLKIEVSMLSAGTALIYSTWGAQDRIKPRLPRPFSEVVQEVSKMQIPPTQRYLTVDIVGSTLDDVDVEELPAIYYYFR
jgi:ubiquitin-activating enzyme E1